MTRKLWYCRLCQRAYPPYSHQCRVIEEMTTAYERACDALLDPFLESLSAHRERRKETNMGAPDAAIFDYEQRYREALERAVTAEARVTELEAREVETPRCGGRRWIDSMLAGGGPCPGCPDCGVETPEAAVEAYRNALQAISDATVPADADVHSEREIYAELARICKQLARDALAQGWTPPGGEDAK